MNSIRIHTKTAQLLIAVIAATVVILSGCSSPLDAQKDFFNLRISPESVEVNKGQETDVHVWVDKADGLLTTRFTLSFDPSIVEVVSVETTTVENIFYGLGADVIAIENSFDNEKGQIVVGVGARREGFTGAQGSGSLAMIVFRTKKTGTSKVRFVNSKPDDIVTTVYAVGADKGWEEVTAQTFDGSILVK